MDRRNIVLPFVSGPVPDDDDDDMSFVLCIYFLMCCTFFFMVAFGSVVYKYGLL